MSGAESNFIGRDEKGVACRSHSGLDLDMPFRPVLVPRADVVSRRVAFDHRNVNDFIREILPTCRNETLAFVLENQRLAGQSQFAVLRILTRQSCMRTAATALWAAVDGGEVG